ncbi:hypothetical protein PENTCL1PPCAC_14189, partial [Pristionchus entomophagus]
VRSPADVLLHGDRHGGGSTVGRPLNEIKKFKQEGDVTLGGSTIQYYCLKFESHKERRRNLGSGSGPYFASLGTGYGIRADHAGWNGAGQRGNGRNGAGSQHEDDSNRVISAQDSIRENRQYRDGDG